MVPKLFLRMLASLLFLLLTVFLPAQVIQTNANPNPAIDYERLKRIDGLVNDYVKSNWIKGAVALVIKDNQLIHYKGYGFADAEARRLMEKNTIFRIMSQTKAIVSVATMMLYEEGKFLLDEPISHFIPEFSKPMVIDQYNATDTSYTTVPAKREITFRDLLTHTSGIGYADIGTDMMKAIYAKARIPSGLGHFEDTLLPSIKRLARLPLAFHPGEKWMYGLNSDVLGCLVEVISGMTLEEFFRTRIFEPLGMKDTYFSLPRDKFNRLAAVYTEDSLKKIIPWGHSFRNIDPDYPMMKNHFFSGGAGLSSTAYDYAVFLQMLLNKGKYNGHSLLSPRTVELMIQNQIGDLLVGKNKFGLGFEITTEAGAATGARSKGTFAWGGYYGTTYWADPEKNMVCLILTQHTPNSHGDLAKKFEVLVYQALKK